MIVLDTHAWVWWASNPEQLSDHARDLIDKSSADQHLYISSISAWEVALLVAKGRLELTMDVEDWIAKFEALPYMNFLPVSNRIALKSVRLPGPLHSDPVDRMIIATALTLGAVLVTKDEKILSYPHVQASW